MDFTWEKCLPSRKLSPAVLDVINNVFKFTKMTPVQTATIPQLLSCKDVAAEAVTGSGKTLAFIVPIIELLFKRHRGEPWRKTEVGALVVSPTRELATQTSEVLEKFLQHSDLQFLKQKLLVGGTSVEEDVESIKATGANILIATPGRLLDLLERNSNDLKLPGRVKSLEILILDEADRLLDMGFETSVNTILSYLPRQRRTGLFSATQTKELLNYLRAGLRNPVMVCVKEKRNQNTPKLLENYFMTVEPEQKFNSLIKFIIERDIKKAMLFLPTCACVEYWMDVLPHFLTSKKVLAIHGKMKLKRGKILQKFRDQENVILLCTDVMARGVDIDEMDWVFQWEPPSEADVFVHRVGRTARQGCDGNALILLLPSENAYVEFLEKNQKVNLKELEANPEWSEDLPIVNKKIHHLQKKDKNIFDKGTRALVSHVKAYSKHTCSLLLRVKDLDLGKVATSYGLLRLPKMPEMKKEFQATFVGPEVKVDVNQIKYSNKQKQESYAKKQKIFQETGEWPGAKKSVKRVDNESWTETKQRKDQRKENRKKRQEVKKVVQEQKTSGVAVPRKRKMKYSKEELEDLAKDFATMKKFKKNKISKEQRDEELGFVDSDDE